MRTTQYGGRRTMSAAISKGSIARGGSNDSSLLDRLCGIESSKTAHERGAAPFMTAVVLLLSYTHIHEVLANYMNGSATALLILTYICLISSLVARRNTIKLAEFGPAFLLFLIIGGWLLGTYLNHPEYSKVLFGPYDVRDYILFPMAAIWTFILFLQDYSAGTFLRSLFVVASICLCIDLFESIEVINNGYWLLTEVDLDGRPMLVAHTYNITWAYKMMCPAVIFIVFYCRTKNKALLLPVLLAAIEIILYGSRGAFVMLVAFWAICSVICHKNKRIDKKGVIVLIIVALLVWLVLTGAFSTLLQGFVNSTGLSSRTIDMAIRGEALNDSGRSLIYDKSMALIGDLPIFGYGVYGDRFNILTIGSIATNGYGYCHDVFLELVITFGIFGVLFLVIGFVLLFRIMMNQDDYDFRCLTLICFGCSLNLILSSSFWYQYYFWALVALIVRYAIGLHECKKDCE